MAKQVAMEDSDIRAVQDARGEVVRKWRAKNLAKGDPVTTAYLLRVIKALDCLLDKCLAC